MGLTQKILLFTSLLVVALVVTSLAFTTVQADRLATESVNRGLSETRQMWDAFQADRYNKLKLGVRVLANDPYFKAAIETADKPTILDTLKERNLELKADFFVATDPSGVAVARTDRPTAGGEDLSAAPLVASALEGEEAATVWKEGDRLYHAVAVPMVTGPDLKGVLIAAYGINEALAHDIHKLSHSDVAFLAMDSGPPRLSVSTLGPREEPLRGWLGRPEMAAAAPDRTIELDLGGARYVGVQVPLGTSDGKTVGSMMALRSMDEEMAAFRRFRKALLVISVVVMVLGLGVAYLVASRITGPVRTLVDMVDRARSGQYTGKVEVGTRDEIGMLARTFNSLLADLREKEQLISFLREGMTMLKKGGLAGAERRTGGDRRAGTQAAGATLVASQETAVIDAVPTLVGGELPRGTRFADRYEVLGTLGKGGMGLVYRAHDRTLDETVALKVVRPEVMAGDPTLLDRFKQEIKLARRITHRNVLRTHDFGEANGTPYISMEYLEGVTLKDLVRGKGALPVPVGLRIAKQMALGLEAAHQQGVVHRDIKPQNMLIIPETGDLKIMDFGIARVSTVQGGDSGLTTAGTVMGTPDYMAPEQAQGQPADFRSDVYALGVVLFEIFTGRLPFDGDNPMQVVIAHIRTPPPAPRSVNPALPEALERIILKAMAKDPAERYQTVSEMLDGLDEVSARAGTAA
ncbi:MAG TPA: protein kinase [Vicinamibacteria bacterium]|nr:protein kinase [Vicinamibacteria bacterium]